MNRNVLFFKIPDKRIRAIHEGLALSAEQSVEIPEARLAFSKDAVPSDVLQLALLTANKRYTNPAMVALKRKFLSAQYRWLLKQIRAHSPVTVICWNGSKGHRLLAMAAAKALGQNCIYLEEAPFAGRIQIDQKGINYGGSLPKTPDFYHRWATLTGQNIEIWRETLAELKSRAPRIGSHVQQRADNDGTQHGRFLFVPLQVPGDTQLTMYGGWINTVMDMVKAVADASTALPKEWKIIIKEHPSAKSALTPLITPYLNERIKLDNQTDTISLIDASSGVVTVNSTVGLQSLMRDRPTITLGQAYYAMPGLAYHAPNQDTLSTLLRQPWNLTYDASLRDVFLSYLWCEHFPSEQDVLSGQFGIEELCARDARKQRLFQSNSPA